MEDEQFRDSPPNESPEKLINQLENVKSAGYANLHGHSKKRNAVDVEMKVK